MVRILYVQFRWTDADSDKTATEQTDFHLFSELRD